MQMQDRSGEQFGNYYLTQLIGKGGFAEVYLAEHKHLNTRQYAIKVLTGTNLEDDQRMEFLDEARTIVNLQRLSPHIVQIFDYGIKTTTNNMVDSGTPWFAMEYAPAGTLRKLYPYGSRVPLQRIALYVNQIAEALQCAHNHKPPIVHRDIKPENMLLRDEEYVLLSDFGIALTRQTEPITSSTKKEKVVGTVTYMAPERIRGFTRRASDQYSLGILVYEWLSGEPPFDGDEGEICVKHLKEPPEPLYQKYPYVTAEIDAVVRRALEKDSENRYPSIQAFAEALTEAIDNASQSQWGKIGNNVDDYDDDTEDTLSQVGPYPVQKPQVIPSATVPDISTGPIPVQSSPLSQQGSFPPAAVSQAQAPLQQPGYMQQLPHQPQQVVASPSSLPSPIALPPAIQPVSNMPDKYEIERMFASPSAPTSSANTFYGPSMQSLPQQSSGGWNLFEFSSLFASDSRFSFFRNVGMLLNICATILFILLLGKLYTFTESIIAGCIGLVFAVVVFMFCIRAVQITLSLFFAALVALYWAALGWLLGLLVVPTLQLEGIFSPFLVGLLFFIVSFALHIWYVSKKSW